VRGIALAPADHEAQDQKGPRRATEVGAGPKPGPLLRFAPGLISRSAGNEQPVDVICVARRSMRAPSASRYTRRSGSRGYAPGSVSRRRLAGGHRARRVRRPVGVVATLCRFLCWQVGSPTARWDSWLASNSHLTGERVGNDSSVVVVLKLDRIRARAVNTVSAKPLHERLL
jgi:hypothetical protein